MSILGKLKGVALGVVVFVGISVVSPLVFGIGFGGLAGLGVALPPGSVLAVPVLSLVAAVVGAWKVVRG